MPEPRSRHASRRASRQDADPCADVAGAEVGTVTGGFELVSYLGRGGMADVYAARDEITGTPVALKRMLPWLATRPHFVELFFHEARIYASLSHPNIVRGIDVGLDRGIPFLVLELVAGSSCDALLRNAGAFPLGVAMTVAHEVLMGLAHAHEARDRDGRALGVVHNDVAPDNIVISRSGQVKLLDFGVAHSLLTGGPMNAQELRGKIGYVSPEHLAGIPTDARTDLFSVGAVLAEMLMGRPLFASSTRFQVAVASFNVDPSMLHDIDAHVPDPLRGVLYTALSRDRDRRFSSARDFAHALRRAATQISRSLEVRQVRDWFGRSGLQSATSGVHEIGSVPRSPELDAKIELIQDEVEERSPTVRLGVSPVRRSTNNISRIGTQRYHVRVGRLAEVRTMTHAEIVAAIVTRRLDATTPIAAISEPWIALGEIPGFSALFRLPAYRSELGARVWQRPFERRELPRLLFQITSAGERGVLETRNGSRWKRIFFEGGAPVFAASNDESELLGSRVQRAGVVGPRQLDELVSVAFFQGRRLGDVLVSAKLLDSAEMLRLLVHQLESRVLELGTWTGGEIGFMRGGRAGLTAPKPLGSPVNLPCHLIRSSYCDDEVAAFLQPLAAAPIRVAEPISKLDGVLTPSEAHVLGRFAEPQTLPGLVSSLSSDTALSPELVRRAVFLGLSAGALECGAAASA